MDPDRMMTPQGRQLAYHRLRGEGPGIVFLGGFMSDMQGSKASHLHAWAEASGRAFVRFDYSGHGASAGAFTDGTIGAWFQDAVSVLQALTSGPQVLVGSSMGGWIALLIARSIPEWIAGIVTIAAAPDFTEAMWDGFTDAQRAEVMGAGMTLRPSDYGAPYPITLALIEDGREHRVLDRPLHIACPVRMLQGTADADVPVATALRLLDHADGPDLRLTLVKGADHRFGRPGDLELMTAAIGEVSGCA